MGKQKKIIYIANEEVIVLEKSQYTYVSHNTHGEEKLSPGTAGVFYHDARDIVNDNGKEKDKDIDRYKDHVKNAAGYQ